VDHPLTTPMGLGPLTGKHQRGQQVRSCFLTRWSGGWGVLRLVGLFPPAPGMRRRTTDGVGLRARGRNQLLEHGEDLERPRAFAGEHQEHAEVTDLGR